MIHDYAIKTVEDLSNTEVTAIMECRPAFFAGSYISVYAPTNLPTGQSFGHALFKYIFQEKAVDQSFLAELYYQIPFEALMELCPNKEKALGVLTDLFSESCFNCVHDLLANKLVDNTISAIITPDYDLTIDQALTGKSCNIVKTPDDLLNIDACQQVYFKIHGSADLPNTIVYTLKQEGELEKWKYDLLNGLTKEKVVVFVGYSGRDFDICPMIAYEQNYKQIVWLHYGDPEDLSPYANYLLNSNPSNLLVTGDLSELLIKLFGTIDVPRFGNGRFDPTSFNLTDDEILIWQLQVLDRLAYSTEGLPLLKRNKNRLPVELYMGLEGSFYAHQGCYRKTANLCLKMARDRRLEVTDRIQQLISAAGTFSAYGNYLASWFYAKKAERLFKVSERSIGSETLLLRMKLTFLMTRNQYYEKLKLRVLQRRLIDEATVIFNELYERLIHDGAWGERQIVQHMAERLKLVVPKRPLALTANVGYRNLGMPGMDIINIKDMVRSDDPEKVVEGLKHIDRAIRWAVNLGMYTETWKQSRLKILKQSLPAEVRDECLKIWWENLNKCEYYWSLKIHHLAEYFYFKFKFTFKSKNKDTK